MNVTRTESSTTLQNQREENVKKTPSYGQRHKNVTRTTLRHGRVITYDVDGGGVAGLHLWRNDIPADTLIHGVAIPLSGITNMELTIWKDAVPSPWNRNKVFQQAPYEHGKQRYTQHQQG